ncbi:hypothetical protein QY97_04017 [Bacillus thermotolerans]|nr:hypothetical protein QY97_04017 [Bacillus thermotolerans]
MMDQDWKLLHGEGLFFQTANINIARKSWSTGEWEDYV